MIPAFTEHKYILYAYRDGELTRVAECDTAQAIGVALVTLAEDNRLAGEAAEMFGVRDAHDRRWISLPFLPRQATPFH